MRHSGARKANRTTGRRRRTDMSSALRRMGTDGSMRKRRARSLAGDDAFTKAESAPDCRCGPAIPTQTCAPATHAGSSTNDCRDHQPPIVAVWRTTSHSLAGSDRSSVRRKSWPRRRAEDARLRRQGKRHAIRRAQWVGMIGLFGHPSEGRCHTFRPKRQSNQRRNRHPPTTLDGREEIGCCRIETGCSSQKRAARCCRDASTAPEPGHLAR